MSPPSDLRNSVANSIDLSGTVIAQDLLLGGLPGLQWQRAGTKGGEQSVTRWPLGDQAWRTARCGADANGPLPRLILRNTQVGALQDSADAWPPNLYLEGFKYDRLGGFGGEGAAGMRARSPEQWRDWLERDRTFSIEPYTQLANVLLAAGHRGIAEEIQFAGRERDRAEAWRRGSCWLWFGLTLFWSVGYGIGDYTFRVLWGWVLALTVVGALVLWRYAPKARRGH